LKLQIIGQNPQLMGVGVPGAPQGEAEMGAEPGGPNPNLGPEGEIPPLPDEGMPPGEEQGSPTGGTGAPQAGGSGTALEEPSEDDLKLYDLEMQTYSREQDAEDIDYSEEL
jgi:hypothetical protein